MKIKVLCINDENKPAEIPQEKWLVKGKEYHIQHVFNQLQQKGMKGVEVTEIDISNCLPYNCFDIQRFAFRPVDLPKLELLIKECTAMNDIDILAILGDLTRLDPIITTKTLLADCKLSIRSKNLFENARVKTVGDLIQLKKSELMKYRNFGAVSFKEVCAFLKEYGYKFKEE